VLLAEICFAKQATDVVGDGAG